MGGADEIVGGDPTLGDTKLREASADLLVKREEYGRAATGTLVGQIAIVGSFLGAFSLLDDNAKAAVVQNDASLVALALAAASLALSLSSYFLLPSKMPSLDNLTALAKFWNDRVRVRRFILVLALIALIGAIVSATVAYADARNAVEPTPAASSSGKFTAAKDAPGSLEATASWSSLDPGDYTVLCVAAKRVLGATVGRADGDGKQTLSLTLPIAATTKGVITLTTVRLASAPSKTGSPQTACQAKSRWVGPPMESIIALG